MDVKELLACIEEVAPPQGQAPWDASGVQIAGRKTDVRKLAVALDPLPEIVAAALDWGAEMILTHHPLALEPHRLDTLNAQHEVTTLTLARQAWLYAAHTSLDVQHEGPVGWLARDLGLTDVGLLETTHSEKLQGVRFQAGARAPELKGHLVGLPGVLHVEEPHPGELFLVCPLPRWPGIKAAIASRLASAAFAMLELTLPEKSWGFGLVGNLPRACTFKEFCASLASLAGRRFYQLCGPRPETVSRVAYCTGSGSSLIPAAKQAGADVFVTGDVKYHQALEAPLSVIDVGHFILEEEMMRRFAQQLAEDPRLAGLELLFFAGQDPFDLLLLGQDQGEPL